MFRLPHLCVGGTTPGCLRGGVAMDSILLVERDYLRAGDLFIVRTTAGGVEIVGIEA